MSRRENPETALVRAILDVLRWEPRAIFWRCNSGSFGPRHVRAGLGDGAADIVGIVEGRFIGLECKMPGEDTRPNQLAWAKSVRAAGGYVYVVRSVEGARAAVSCARAGEEVA